MSTHNHNVHVLWVFIKKIWWQCRAEDKDVHRPRNMCCTLPSNELLPLEYRMSQEVAALRDFKRELESIDAHSATHLRSPHLKSRPLQRNHTFCPKCAQCNFTDDHGACTQLLHGDPSRTVVESIFKTRWRRPGIPCGKIECVMKVGSAEKRVARFEKYREMVKSKASNLVTKHQHPRCLADGNEMLRFHGTTIMCSLGVKGSLTLCTLADCNACKIIRTGFLPKDKQVRGRGRGVYTTASSGRAHDYMNMSGTKRAMFICRVIAGQVHNPQPSHVPAIDCDSDSDSFAADAKLEEIFVFSRRGVLPCFLLIYS